MKRNKRVISILTALMCLGVLLMTTGCGKSKPSAVDTGKFFFNFLVKQDTTDISKFEIKDDQAKTMLDSEKSATKTQTSLNFSKGGIKISDDQLNAIVDAQYNALKSIDATVEAGSESGDKVTVTITAPYIDFTAIDTKAANDAQESVLALNITDRNEALKKVKETYIQNLLDGLKNAKPSSETNKGTYQFKKDSKTGFWMPDMDAKEFGKALIGLVIGKK